MVKKIIGTLFFCIVLAVVVMAVVERCRRGGTPAVEVVEVQEEDVSLPVTDGDARNVMEGVDAEDYVIENMGVDTIPENAAQR